jgi:hypothetical protein
MVAVVTARWLFVPARWSLRKMVRSYFFVGFVKEMEEILHMVMMLQKIVYGEEE